MAARQVRLIVLFCMGGILLCPDVSSGELEAYGERLCKDAGIPLDECSLIPPEANHFLEKDTLADLSDDGHADKSETYAKHARRLCAKEGVALNDCKALPPELRTVDRDEGRGTMATSDVSALPALGPPRSRTSSSLSAHGQQAIRDPGPPGFQFDPPPLSSRNATGTSQSYDPAWEGYGSAGRYQDLRPEPSLRPTERYPVDGRRISGPLERAWRVDRYRTDAGRSRETVRYDVPSRDDGARSYRERTVGRQNVLDRQGDRPRDFRIPFRCLRSVRYSAPPSYRYVACID